MTDSNNQMYMASNAQEPIEIDPCHKALLFLGPLNYMQQYCEDGRKNGREQNGTDEKYQAMMVNWTMCILYKLTWTTY